MKKLAILMGVTGIFVAIFLWFLSAPDLLDRGPLPNGDLANGKVMFWAGGCASCHAAPKSKGDARFVLGGGLELKTSFGVFRVPNISPAPQYGIGNWSNFDFAKAMLKGVSPAGSHYFPAFPYTSYSRMNIQDVMDLWAFLKTLPKTANQVADHGVPFPFNIRRAVGLWKWLYFKPGKVVEIADATPQVLRGQYLVEGPGHCSECHTQRNLLGGMDMSRWLAGGKALEGDEFIANITPHKTGIGDWSVEDIAYSLESGFTPSFDTFGSSMVEVQENMAELPAKDREAIAAYLKAIPAVKKIPVKKKK
jgi:mono/diheme cytochrome c family protein